jgi:hypothetical protein
MEGSGNGIIAQDEGGSDNRYEKLRNIEHFRPRALKHIFEEELMCILEIKKDFTTITNTLTDDENAPENRCVIETEELKNLILVWHQLRRLDTKQRNTDAIRRVSTPMANQSLTGNALPNDVREVS